jgi:hypothetical protein
MHHPAEVSAGVTSSTATLWISRRSDLSMGADREIVGGTGSICVCMAVTFMTVAVGGADLPRLSRSPAELAGLSYG